ncbi:hypothetical protein BgiMline_027260 [Biomphalaria glabrata]|uniref:Uncharacterized protein LOC106056918 n=1 Tax=Biomphalaria glabrata TaxID=6526 RepID=A0A2C9KQ42_BIOGL|nr:uncharacterized protein LOC106056918 [Biomphalaria glabrata]KAI8738157.1 ribosomal protein 63; mitochondrial-like [Biomphalaria glabrata]KAI8739364.1 ribosomal protein 63, mitochondrial [Biomphalaria glabrata]
MKLTNVLQFYTRYRRVNGLLRFGKYRVIPPISVNFKRKVAELMCIEKDNLDIINKPFLSADEENAFHKVVPRVPYKNDKTKKDEQLTERLDNLPPNYTTKELFAILNCNKKWE